MGTTVVSTWDPSRLIIEGMAWVADPHVAQLLLLLYFSPECSLAKKQHKSNSSKNFEKCH